MDDKTATGVVNQILHGIDRVEDLNAPEPPVDCVDAMFEGRYFADPPAEYLEAIDVVLASGRLSEQSVGISENYDSDQLLTFLRRVADELRSRLANGAGQPG